MENMNAIAPLSKQKLLNFFIIHLNSILCAKSHIVDRFPEAAELAHFSDIKLAILETRDDVKNQCDRMREIFRILDKEPSFTECTGLTGMLDEAFSAIYEYQGDAPLRDMSILFYLQNIESVETVSFGLMKMTARQLHNPQIDQLLQENFDEAKADQKLLLMITAKYLEAQ